MRIVHRMSDLAADMRRIAATTRPMAAQAVAEAAREGSRDAKRLARRSAGKHGKHYPDAIGADALTALIWEYGPDSEMPQGGMSFEGGSRNQPPHLDLAQSADKLPLTMGRKVDRIMDRQFW